MRSLTFNIVRGACFFVVLLSALAASGAGWAVPRQFLTPEDAVKALVAAAKEKDTNQMEMIFGSDLHKLVSADPVVASNRFETFARRVVAKVTIVHSSADKVTLELGHEAWPFPIPLVRQNAQWFFDTAAGAEEIINRRIGHDELATLAVCQSYVDAQREYASQDRMGDGVLQFAQKLRGDSGRHNGLYWHASAGEESSPFGPLIAQACAEGYRKGSKIMTDSQKPYHGYYFKILTRQGSHAAGGKFDYIINGRMIAGFALVAWPAVWGNTGFMTFIVNQNGRIYEKCLGEDTARIASKMTAFDPDASWTPTQEP